ncbi:bacitracin export permease protein BceB [Clostridium tepidiprofundi DSM 19306]|uniref:Bacitracin export permease protein BceB n=1 Tax=Clostridium tepidiprofundi DSM 19306 TaxID=1121338 RepID=A0A151B4H0_9CLOT|nr:ABC transporter permease [Clostridium tepidiprofundi]KYH34690.1 bacitracin export permease protein BceB [Clostridium tepidiprofundi DSM 19306]
MNLFKIASKNIRRNFYNYFLYFTSMVFSIIIYFTFVSIEYNKQVLVMSKSITKIDVTFKASSIVIAIFVAIFIWYSNSFFIKKRKKEIGLYSLLGIKKRQIGRMLFYENIVMGILALGTGILLGSLLSKVFIMLLVRLMGFSIYIKFTIVPKAIINTFITFFTLFFITSVHGYSLIYRFKLIELFKAENKGEKEPKVSIIATLISIILIIGGYILYISAIKLKLNFLYVILATLILVITGTYMFFSSFILFVIKLSKKNKKKYYKGINLIGTSQLLYRIKSSSRTLATIAVLSATTLTAMGIASSQYYGFYTKQETHYPFSYVINMNNTKLDKKVEFIMNKYPKNKMINSVNIKFIKAKTKFPDYTTTCYIISESKYNEIAKIRKLKYVIKLNTSNECVYFTENINKNHTYNTLKINFNNKYEQFNITNFKYYPIINKGIAPRTIVVKDEIYNKYCNNNNIYSVKAYINANKKDAESLTKELNNLISKEYSNANNLFGIFSSYYENYKSNLAISGLIIFIASFLGLVFLMATGSIIFFKQLSEANDDKPRYMLLKKIGVNKREIKVSIAKQILFIFVLPLVLGAIHSFVAVSVLGDILNINLTIPIGISVISYTLIYMAYYLLTVNSYNKIVNSNI